MAVSPFSHQKIRAVLDLLFEPGDTIEIRALDGRRTDSGYFTDFDKVAGAIKRYDGAANIYVSLNPVDPDLIARSNNRMKEWAKTTTNDSEIVRRRWLPIDFDPQRPAGISATDAEHEMALATARKCAAWLGSLGWGQPVVGDSGNGAHLLYPIDLPNTPESADLIRDVLLVVKACWEPNTISVDTGNFNAARIWKLYGTMAVKGDTVPQRPHRRSQILSIPEDVTAITLDQLTRLVAERLCKPRVHPTSAGVGGAFDLRAWLQKFNIGIHQELPFNGGTKFRLSECPWDNSHTPDGTAIMWRANGGISFTCHHNRCQGVSWQDVRTKFEPEYPDWVAKAEAKRNGTPLTAPVSSQPDVWQRADDAVQLRKFNRTDLGNATRFIADHGDNVRYVKEWDMWLVWDGTRWQKDMTYHVYRLAERTIDHLWTEVRATRFSSTEDQDKWFKWCAACESKGKIEAMLELAKTKARADGTSYIAITTDELDAQPWLLNCLNGTLDLKTGMLLPHTREHLLTKRIETPYSPTATAPTWHTFLDRVMASDTDLIAFLQRVVGYTLTGDTSEQCLFFAYGTGQNGKSKFFNALSDLLGEYWLKSPTEMIMARGLARGIPNDVAQLFGARMAVTAEIESNRRLAEALVKDLTSDDKLTARLLYGEYFYFQPTHKLFIYGNHRPIIGGTDHGIWRRIKEIPFKVTIPKEERDGKLGEKLKAELPGILAWAVAGCLDWQQGGLREPEVVTQATANYRKEMDVLGLFLDECCVTASTATVKASDLYAAYTTWCDEVGESKFSARKFGMQLSERGFDRHRSSSHWSYVGLGLLVADTATVPDNDRMIEDDPISHNFLPTTTNTGDLLAQTITMDHSIIFSSEEKEKEEKTPPIPAVSHTQAVMHAPHVKADAEHNPLLPLVLLETNEPASDDDVLKLVQMYAQTNRTPIARRIIDHYRPTKPALAAAATRRINDLILQRRQE